MSAPNVKTRPRVVTDSHGHKWKVINNRLHVLDRDGWTVQTFEYVITAERAALWADLFANPTEPVPTRPREVTVGVINDALRTYRVVDGRLEVYGVTPQWEPSSWTPAALRRVLDLFDNPTEEIPQ